MQEVCYSGRVYLDNGGGGWSFKDLSLLDGLCGASSLMFSLSDSPEGWYIGLCGSKRLDSGQKP